MNFTEISIDLENNKAVLEDGTECELIELKDGQNALINLAVSKENEIGKGKSAKLTPIGITVKDKKEAVFISYDIEQEIKAKLKRGKGNIDFIQEAFILESASSDCCWSVLVGIDGRLFLIPVEYSIPTDSKFVVAGQAIFPVKDKDFEKAKSKLKDKVFFYTTYTTDDVKEKINEIFYKKILEGKEDSGLFFYTFPLEKYPISDKDKSLLMKFGTLVIFDRPVEPNKLGNVRKVEGIPDDILEPIKSLDTDSKNIHIISQFVLKVGLKANCS